MKILKNNFNPFEFLKAWGELSHDTRLLFLTKIDSTLKVPDSVFSPEQTIELIDTGFRLADTAMLAPDLRPFRNLIRSMHRHPHFAPSTKELDLDYVTDHLINSESGGISGAGRHFFRRKPAQIAKETAVDSSWLNGFLNADSFEQWENKHANYNEPHLDTTAAALLKTWIERLLNGENPIPFSALLKGAPDTGYSAQNALRAGVRYLLLFPALDPETLDPLIGIWPAIHALMNRKKPEVPAPVDLPEGCETYSVPILLHDMTVLLVATTGEGLRLKAQGDLFKKEEAALAERLVSMPPSGSGYKPPHHGRLDTAHVWLSGMKLVRSSKTDKKRWLKATPAGKQWLAGSEGERLKELADFMRKTHKRNMNGKWMGYDEIAFVPNNPQHHARKGEFNLEESVIEAFLSCPVGQWIPTPDFLTWQVESENPFLLSQDDEIERIFNHWNNSDVEREHRWKRVLQDFFQERLIPLGAIRTAFGANGSHWFALTPSGAYLLGLTDEFEYETEAVAGDIIVQPNFEIVFTAVNPFAEGELSRYADRTGYGVGTLFRITRASVHRALDSGMEGDQILESLQPLASKKLPANVVAQIRDWGNSFRRVAVQTIAVIRCPDADTALHVHALFPQKTVCLTETLLQIKSPNDLAPLKKKLRQNGVGIE